jgi:hypothetical protein
MIKSVIESSMEIMPNLPSTATAVLDTVSASAVPCHADKQTTIVTKVGRPVVLAVSLRQTSVNACHTAILRLFTYQEGLDVLLETIVVKALEGLSVVELGLVRVAGSGVLAQDVEPELIGPPVTVLDVVSACCISSLDVIQVIPLCHQQQCWPRAAGTLRVPLRCYPL